MPAGTHDDLDLAGLRLAPARAAASSSRSRSSRSSSAASTTPAEPERGSRCARSLAHGRQRLRAATALRARRSRDRACAASRRRAPTIEVDAREVDVPGGGEELSSPYVEDEVLDLARWAHDAFALGMPVQVLCRPDCAGLCPVCAANLNEAGPEHHHERAPDPRWAKLRELRLE